jgi:hypothetical protein
MEGLRRTSLGIVLQSAVRNRLERGWIYFADEDALQLDTPCLFIPDALDLSEFGEDATEIVAAREGFPVCGLDSVTMLMLVEGLRNSGIGISDKSLLQSFVYYLKRDAFLPHLDPAPPLPREEIGRRLDREFFDALGPERAGTACKIVTCARGRISQSVFCRVHHFESVKRKPCPFVE